MKKSSLKKGLIITSIFIGGLFVFGQRKYKTALYVMNHIKLGIKKVSNFKFSLRDVKFNAVLTLQNQTNIDFGATISSKIVIKTIKVYNANGTYLGKANTDIYKINLPSKQTIELPEATFSFDLGHAFNEFVSNHQNYLNNDFSQLKYKIDVEVFGNLLTLEA